MDSQTNAALGIAGVVSGIASVVYTYLKHSRCKGHICGKETDIAIDLSPVVPEKLAPIKVDESSGNQTEKADVERCNHCNHTKVKVQDA
jgi:hypothetical protein